MKNFTDYAEKAIRRFSLTGYNNLARELGLNKATVSYFRSGKALPSEDTMVKLAELAGMPKEEALIDLNLWRSKDKPELQKIWLRLSKMIGCAALFSVLSTYANACNSNVNESAKIYYATNNIYYATNIYCEVVDSPYIVVLIHGVVCFVKD